jgi:hypothetical protein
MCFDYETSLHHITIYYLQGFTVLTPKTTINCLQNLSEENIKEDKMRCGHRLLLPNPKHEVEAQWKRGKIHGCKGRGCHLKSHSESANHWSLCPHKITEAYCALRVSVLSVHHHPSQNSCQKHPYYADVNGICTCIPRAIQTEIVN